MRYAVVLAIVLGVYWMCLSGYTTPMLLTLGTISIVLVVFLCSRMGIIDEETVPYLHLPTALSYYVWLFVEIIKANVQVLKAVLSPAMEISPTMVMVPRSPRGDIAAAMFANSITLTPGTVSVEMEENDILVHALLEEMIDMDGFADMAERSAWAVGEGEALPEEKT